MKAIQHLSAYGNPAQRLRMVDVTALRSARIVSEFSEVSGRMLERSQSTELGND
jgi:hypothetical protein